ncbi:unnamed protein product [Lupinus luteus]|uniref:Uncharacterized protein n=1 Tax=Lupinus luteus TaxID=3873 RepID=A0AAV1X4T9_LUPLU
MTERSYILKMVIIRDIVTDFSDDEEIELCDDDDDIEATEPGSIAYANPSSFFVNVDSAAGKDIDYGSSHLKLVDRINGIDSSGPKSWTQSTRLLRLDQSRGSYPPVQHALNPN